jgi:hypothetical protein
MKVGRRKVLGGRRYARSAAISLGAVLVTLLLVCPAYGQDLTAALSEAESAATSAETEIAAAEARFGPMQVRYAASTGRAVPAKRSARSARRQADALEAASADRQRAAAARVSRIEADHQREVDDHDGQVRAGLGLGLAALVLAAIALGWGRFRASAGVAWLTRQQHGQAIGLCVGAGFVLLIVGVAIAGADGILGVVGFAVFVLALAFPVAFLLARHSAQIEHGRATPVLKRKRMPAWVTRSVAVAMAVLFLVGFGSALFSSAPEPELASAQLRGAAEGRQGGAATQRLAAAKVEARRLEAKASHLGSVQAVARTALRQSRRQLAAAESQLARAQRDSRRYAARIVAEEAREVRVAERQAREEAEEIEALEQESEEEAASECDPNYVGACLSPSSYDYDCLGGSGDGPDYTGPVQSVGSDPYGLDADGDGYACEE